MVIVIPVKPVTDRREIHGTNQECHRRCGCGGGFAFRGGGAGAGAGSWQFPRRRRRAFRRSWLLRPSRPLRGAAALGGHAPQLGRWTARGCCLGTPVGPALDTPLLGRRLLGRWLLAPRLSGLGFPVVPGRAAGGLRDLLVGRRALLLLAGRVLRMES